MSPSNPQYRTSRSRCLSSAIQLLKHQATINQEIQPGGLLYRDKWFASSLTSFDFLLAAMVVCLELQHGEKRSEEKGTAGDQEVVTSNDGLETHGREELLQALQISHDLWSLAAPHSKDAANASEACAVMLGKVRNSPSAVDGINTRMSVSSTAPGFGIGGAAGSYRETNSAREGTMAREENSTTANFCPGGDEWISVDQERMFPSAPTFHTTPSDMVPGAANMHPGGVVGSAEMDTSIDINWRLWDTQIQHMGIQQDWMNEQSF